MKLNVPGDENLSKRIDAPLNVTDIKTLTIEKRY